MNNYCDKNNIKVSKLIGKGLYGKVYEITQHNNIYAMKWISYNNIINTTSMENEIKWQEYLSKLAITVPIITLCKNEDSYIHGWIMLKLDTTLYEDLFHLSKEQLDKITNFYLFYIEEIIMSLPVISSKKYIYFKKYLDMLKKSLTSYECYNTFYKVLELWYKYYPDKFFTIEKKLIITDTEEQMIKKQKYVDQVIELLLKLEKVNIYHGDSHCSNFMRIDDTYYVIDFGRTYEEKKSTYNKHSDIIFLMENVNKYIDKEKTFPVTHNLNYLTFVK